MSNTPAAASSSPARAARATKPRNEGQWALGQREPLNANEAFKQADDALNVRSRILDIYAKEGFDSIPSDDLRGRMRWMGLYTQRAEGFDGGKTATVDPDELDAPYFMMRVRTDGSVLTADALRALGEVSQRYARDTADMTDRQNIQYHWIDIRDVPAIWERLDEVGLTSIEACGDSPRPILGSPVAGVAADEIIDATPAVEEIRRRLLGNPEYSNLPRKYKTSISGHPSWDGAPEINDVSFVGVEHPEHGPGFDLWVGGGLSTNPIFATRLGVWIPIEDVPDVWEAVTAVFRDYGYRRLRNRARLKFLLADWGGDKFRQVLQDEYLGRALISNPSPTAATRSGDHIGVHEQKDGRFYLGAAAKVGRINGRTLSALGDLIEQYGATGVRLTSYQKLVVLGVEKEQVDALTTDLAELGLEVNPSPFRRSTMACTGIEFCKLAIVETKNRAIDLIGSLEQRFPELDTPVTININGCPNACARTQVADIGLKGQLVVDESGEQVEGFQVHLGGGLGVITEIGRKLRAHKVTSAGLDDYITNVLQHYLAERTEGESFATWVTRTDEESLRGEHVVDVVTL